MVQEQSLVVHHRVLLIRKTFCRQFEQIESVHISSYLWACEHCLSLRNFFSSTLWSIVSNAFCKLIKPQYKLFVAIVSQFIIIKTAFLRISHSYGQVRFMQELAVAVRSFCLCGVENVLNINLNLNLKKWSQNIQKCNIRA